MKEQLERLLEGMADAGCSREEIQEAKRLADLGDGAALKRHLRKCRCGLVDEMHESQKRVDCIDYLIRQAEKMTVK